MVSPSYEDRICAMFDSFVLHVDGHSCVVEIETLFLSTQIPTGEAADRPDFGLLAEYHGWGNRKKTGGNDAHGVQPQTACLQSN